MQTRTCTVRSVSRYGCVGIPAYGYPEALSEFVFHTCLSRPEVISATVKIRAECNKVAKMSLFSTAHTKSSRMDEFEQIQVQACDAVANHLKDR
jgi:dynein heavy chain